MDPIDHAEFVKTCHLALHLANTPEVASAWDTESACAGMTAGALTCHLLSQTEVTAGFLHYPPPTALAPITLLEHFDRAEWVSASFEDEAHSSVRVESEESAAAGPTAVLADAAGVLDRLATVLDAPRDPAVVYLPWHDWALTTDDFLVSRAMELVVHSDDLAASVGLPTPEFPPTVIANVVHILGAIGLQRHGQDAVVRTLIRPQRAPDSFAAF
jgi:hypothetical protein